MKPPRLHSDNDNVIFLTNNIVTGKESVGPDLRITLGSANAVCSVDSHGCQHLVDDARLSPTNKLSFYYNVCYIDMRVLV